MARKEKAMATRATQMLERAGVPFNVHVYPYIEKGGTRASSSALGVDEHRVIKTLLFETDERKPVVVCQHGDRMVSAKDLARLLGTKSVRPCDPAVAERHSGYRVGGTSPFGLKKQMPVYVEQSVLALDEIYINGGARGQLVSLHPSALMTVLAAIPVNVATNPSRSQTTV